MGYWIKAGFGIAVGMFLFSLIASIPMAILWFVLLSNTASSSFPGF